MITVHFPVLSPCIYTTLCNYSIVLEFALYVFFGLILAVLFYLSIDRMLSFTPYELFTKRAYML